VRLLRRYAALRPFIGLKTFGDDLFAAPGSTFADGADGADSHGDITSAMVTSAFDLVQQLAGNDTPQHVNMNRIRHVYATR